MTDRYAVVALRDLGHVTAGQAHWHTIRSTLDVRAFGINAETPDNAGVLYNLACAKARAGRTDEALADLRRAVELRASLGESAHADDELASLRGDPSYAAGRVATRRGARARLGGAGD